MNELGPVQALFKAIDDAWFLLNLKLGEERDSISEYCHFRMGNFASEAEGRLFVLRQILSPLATHELVETQMNDRKKYLSETESEEEL